MYTYSLFQFKEDIKKSTHQAVVTIEQDNLVTIFVPEGVGYTICLTWKPDGTCFGSKNNYYSSITADGFSEFNVIPDRIEQSFSFEQAKAVIGSALRDKD